jgi:hypothetical protein
MILEKMLRENDTCVARRSPLIAVKRLTLLLLAVLTAGRLPAQQEPPNMPMQPVLADGAQARWLGKKVSASRLLDSMEDLSTWSFKGDGEMQLAASPVRDGQHSLRITSKENLGLVGGAGEWEDLVASRKFPSEDWSRFNRLSLWVYPDIIGAPALSASLVLHNEGAHRLPDRYNEGRHESIPLVNHQWNHVVWEIAPLDREKVTQLDFAYSMPKMFPDPGDQTILYIDQLELQLVDADHVEGWDVSPGVISFSHAGYTSGASKTAIASHLDARSFSVVDQHSGKVVFSAPVRRQKTPLGEYLLMDFSALQTPGDYLLRAGSVTTRPFRVGPDAWRDSIWKAINFMHSERCGTVIPGIHGICHLDDYTVHGEKRIVVSGGYHDAGDLSATGNTPGMAYALFSFAERLEQQQQDPVLRERLLEEGKWGLRWVLKTTFADGFRSTGQLISYWTNGIMGDADDRFGQAVNNPEWNFRVAAVEALAARVLKNRDPELALRSLRTAQQDWEFAVTGLASAAPLVEVYGAQDELERLSFGVIASVDLYRATGESRYSEEAFQLAALILASQEQNLQPWTIPLTGYFYTSPKRENLFHRFHIGQEEEPIVALTHLCQTFPNHPDWMKWYAAVVLHSRFYQQAAAKLDAPYDVLPAAIYKESEVRLLSPQSKDWTPLRAADQDSYLQQVRQGVPLGGEYYLRRFPVWFDFRGNSSVLLSQAKALSTAALLRGDWDAQDLAQRQAQWILGRNPFSASIMYGAGYDWTPLYSVRSGQMVGAIPVGMETREFNDVPYWPNQICWTYKEVWTQPVGEWIWLMAELHGSAVVEGVTTSFPHEPIIFRDSRTGRVTQTSADPTTGKFRAVLPPGGYSVRHGAAHTALTALSGGLYSLDLRPDTAVDFRISADSRDSELTLHLHAEGADVHQFELRTANLSSSDSSAVTLNLSAGQPSDINVHFRVLSPATPWILVVIPDRNLNMHQELSGAVNQTTAGDQR